jgi:hypothetical protein
MRRADQGIEHAMNDSFPRLPDRTPPPRGAGSGRSPGPGPGPGPIARLLGGLAGLAVLAAAMLFSAVLVVLLLAVGAAAFGWFWWKTRALRRALREQMRDGRPGDAGVRGRSTAPGDGARAPLARRQDEVEDAEIIREVPDRGPRPRG